MRKEAFSAEKASSTSWNFSKALHTLISPKKLANMLVGQPEVMAQPFLVNRLPLVVPLARITKTIS
jgi:hypothetical protein